MNAAYDNPIPNHLPFKDMNLAKVYRETFANKEDLADSNSNSRLNEINFIDVTDDYINTLKRIKIHIPKDENDVYLCVLNGRSWKPVDKGIKDNSGNVIFEHIGQDILYTIAKNNKGFFLPIGEQFYLRDSKIIPLALRVSDLKSLSINVSDISKHLYQKDVFLSFWNDKNNSWTRMEHSIFWI